MDKSLRESLIQRLIQFCETNLGSHSTYSSPALHCRNNKGLWGKYFLLLNRTGDIKIFLKEVFCSDTGEQETFRSWMLVKDSAWDLVRVEKNGHSITLEELKKELIDLNSNIDKLHPLIGKPGFYLDTEIQQEELFIEIPRTAASRRLSGRVKKESLLLSRGSLIVSAFVILISFSVVAINNGRYVKLKKATEDINSLLSDYNAATEAKFKNIDLFISTTIQDLELLIKDVETDQATFEFNRRNAFINVMRLAEELTRNLPARKEAYKLIAENIMEAHSYGEIIYEISRLPSEEYQARILLATDRQKVETLSRLRPVFSHLLYPVKLAEEPNNGKGFRITSGYMDKRKDPLGSGGIKPHYAVDIINVSNISFINYAGEIIRQGNHPGNAVAVADGVVTDINFDAGYGWYVEIDHGLHSTVKERYPDCTSYRTFYAHLSQEPELSKGEEIVANQILGLIGDSGISTGPHLHFEIRIYRETGAYKSSDGRFDKIDPYPSKMNQ